MTQGKQFHTILIAEDEENVRSYLKNILSQNGFNVLEAKNGKEAIEMCKEKGKAIGAILSDIRMPILDGRAFAKYNYENLFHPFVVYTTFSDSKLALDLLKTGVYDYLTKPVQDTVLIGVLKGALLRRSLSSKIPDDENPYAGNVGQIVIPSHLNEINRAINWITSNLTKHFLGRANIDNFVIYVTELLLNAHEHGNLNISEEEKSDLIRKNTFTDYLSEMEKKTAKKISVSLSIIKNEVAIQISDDGKGFNYKKYLVMGDDEILERIELPNGRGIIMAKGFFDSIIYTKGGSTIMVTKKIPQ
ncbi:MAG: response regulator [Nitrospinae bacterium]|nr:response regulator [Nitrospinota bacterium]